MNLNPHMRFVLTICSIIALVLFALTEVLLSWPVAWWLYAILACIFIVTLALGFTKISIPRLTIILSSLISMATLYSIEWSSRKPFLRDLYSVRVGMTEQQVVKIMGKYISGTGFPANPYSNPSELHDNTGKAYKTESTSDGFLHLPGRLVFRHSDTSEFGADWGIVSFLNGRVVDVEFSPD